jgi:hypothetical protein
MLLTSQFQPQENEMEITGTITEEQLKELQELRDKADKRRWHHWHLFCRSDTYGEDAFHAVSDYAKETAKYERINTLIEIGIGYPINELIKKVGK